MARLPERPNRATYRFLYHILVLPGGFAYYFIPTEKFDFHIICRTLIYLYDGNPWEGYPEEMLDTLPRVVIKTYPDQISELEKAVEETFRPK
jgi:hypothetical protein